MQKCMIENVEKENCRDWFSLMSIDACYSATIHLNGSETKV